jgi:hypothetical protein
LNFDPPKNPAFGIRRRNLPLSRYRISRNKNILAILRNRQRDRLNNDLADLENYLKPPPILGESANVTEGIATSAPIKTAKATANIFIRPKNPPLRLWIFI